MVNLINDPGKTERPLWKVWSLSFCWPFCELANIYPDPFQMEKQILDQFLEDWQICSSSSSVKNSLSSSSHNMNRIHPVLQKQLILLASALFVLAAARQAITYCIFSLSSSVVYFLSFFLKAACGSSIQRRLMCCTCNSKKSRSYQNQKNLHRLIRMNVQFIWPSIQLRCKVMFQVPIAKRVQHV